MKVQTRLSIASSVVFGIVFAAISVLIYGLYHKNAEKALYDHMETTSYLIALFYLEEDELNNEEFSHIKAQFNRFVSNAYYQIYNERDSVYYGSDGTHVSGETLNLIREKESLFFSDEEFYCYGIYYEDNQGDFVVVAKERKSELQDQLQILLWILFIAFIIGIVLIILLSRLLAYVAYRPFSDVIDQVNNISTHNLDVQIESPGTNDELQDLIDTFNDLLSKISDTVIMQKNFVKYVSHEFKTPLASLLGNLEVFAMKDRTPKEYEAISQKLIKEIYQLQEILDTLIVISDLREKSDAFSYFRIDELVWQIISKISEWHQNAKILVNMNVLPEDESLLTIHKDRTQLLMALFNLIENAAKYSKGRTVEISMEKADGRLCFSIKDDGIGIPDDQLKHISKPFYRADNVYEIRGSGIGLSIALRILEKNDIRYDIESKDGEGTLVRLFL